MNKTKICLKCEGPMIIGNYTGKQVDWEKDMGHSFLQGSGKNIVTYACNHCGYLESYVKR